MSKEQRSVLDILISRLFGLLCFLIVLYILDYSRRYTDSELYSSCVFFLKENTTLIIFMGVVYAAGEIFGALTFPLNLPAPIINAVASVFLADFLFRILFFVGEVTDERIFRVFSLYKDYVFPIIFIAVLIGGYALIFAQLLYAKKKKHREGAK